MWQEDEKVSTDRTSEGWGRGRGAGTSCGGPEWDGYGDGGCWDGDGVAGSPGYGLADGFAFYGFCADDGGVINPLRTWYNHYISQISPEGIGFGAGHASDREMWKVPYRQEVIDGKTGQVHDVFGVTIN